VKRRSRPHAIGISVTLPNAASLASNSARSDLASPSREARSCSTKPRLSEDDPPPPLSFRDIIRVLQRLQGLEVVLVGGQAVNHWAEHYLRQGRALDLEPVAPFTSEDIDFKARRALVAECAQRLGGTAKLPTLDDSTVNSGIVIFKDDGGYQRQIDMLATIGGLDEDDVEKSARSVAPLGEDDPLRVRVLHPERSMESRAHNIVKLGGRYDSEHGHNQFRASVSCAREYMLDLLDLGEDGVRAALNHAERVYKFVVSPLGLDVFERTGIDPFQAVAVDDRLPDRFVDTRYPQMLKKIEEKRAKKRR
jgi:hypothetical protein